MSVIKIQGLSKSFGRVKALDHVDLEVQEGEVFGFIGPNGAGKTTTIRSILGILKPDNGNISVFGQDAWKDAVQIHKKIAFVPGDVSLWSNLTGGEVIDLFVSLRSAEIKSKKEELIKIFDLDISKKCRTYSKGNRQKVALVAALAAEADLYVLDEPTSGLDPLMEKVFQDYVRALKKAGKTIFLSSHILSEVEQLCDRVCIIRKGKIIETGSLMELRHLMRNQVIIETSRKVSGLEGIAGIFDLIKEGNKYQFQAGAKEIEGVLKHFSNFGILQLQSMPPTLEDLFMHHYNDEGGASDE